jgi:hypothetical protein
VVKQCSFGKGRELCTEGDLLELGWVFRKVLKARLGYGMSGNKIFSRFVRLFTNFQFTATVMFLLCNCEK